MGDETIQLVVEPTHLKNMLLKLDHFPKVRDEIETYLKPPSSDDAKMSTTLQ